MYLFLSPNCVHDDFKDLMRQEIGIDSVRPACISSESTPASARYISTLVVAYRLLELIFLDRQAF